MNYVISLKKNTWKSAQSSTSSLWAITVFHNFSFFVPTIMGKIKQNGSFYATHSLFVKIFFFVYLLVFGFFSEENWSQLWTFNSLIGHIDQAGTGICYSPDKFLKMFLFFSETSETSNQSFVVTLQNFA